MDSPGTVAALVTVIIALSKVIDFFIKRWDTKKNGKSPIHLHPEVSRQIRETYEKVHTNNIMIERDISDMKNHQEKMAEHLASVAKHLDRVVETQEKTLEIIEKVDRRQDIEDEVRRRVPTLVE